MQDLTARISKINDEETTTITFEAWEDGCIPHSWLGIFRKKEYRFFKNENSQEWKAGQEYDLKVTQPRHVFLFGWRKQTT